MKYIFYYWKHNKAGIIAFTITTAVSAMFLILYMINPKNSDGNGFVAWFMGVISIVNLIASRIHGKYKFDLDSKKDKV